MKSLTYLAGQAPNPPDGWFHYYHSQFYLPLRPQAPIIPLEHLKEVTDWRRDLSYDLPENLAHIQIQFREYDEKVILADLQATLKTQALWAVIWARAILTQLNNYYVDEPFNNAFPHYDY